MRQSNNGKKDNVFKIMLRSFSFLGEYKCRYLTGWLLSASEFAIVFITPYMYKKLIEMITGGTDTALVQTVMLLFAALILLSPLVGLGAYLRYTAVAEGVGNIQKSAFNHLQHMPVLKTIENKTGDYINRLSNDASVAVGMFQGYAVTGFFKFVVYFTVSFVLLLRLSVVLLAISVIFSVGSFISATTLNPKARSLERAARKITSDSASYLVEAFRCMPVIRVFLLKDRMLDRYREACKIIMEKRVSFRTLLGAAYGVTNILSSAVQPIGILVGVAFLLGVKMEMAQIVFAVSVMTIMADGMKEFGTFTQFIQSGIVASKRVFELLDEPLEQDAAGGVGEENAGLIDPNAEYAVCFDNARFAYRAGEDVLKGISFRIGRGETVALVGGSGGGKTTVLKLIQAFYTKCAGDIRLFGASAEDLTIYDIRKQVSYVQQDCVLFDGSIYENISLGMQEYSRAEIITAAKKAGIHDFIVSLPDGYDTVAGERGALLSGGQKQRITLARAFLKNAPILLLDEATAALDSQTEEEVGLAISELVKGKTAIIVAHRLSTVKNADRIIVIEDGTVVEEGNHLELMRKNGRYRQLAESSAMLV